jgi:C-terminal processing protease CtpA/Prc
MICRPWVRGGPVILISLLCLCAARAATPPPDPSPAGLANPDFEQGAVGQPPPGWFVPKVLADEGFSAVLSGREPARGEQCVELRWPSKDRPAPKNPFANLMQRLEAGPWRGKRIRVTAAIRVSPGEPDGRAQMWLRVDRPGGIGAFDNMNDRPVRSETWTEHSIVAEVADDAVALNLGLMSRDGATAWLDHVRLEILATVTTLTEPARPLSEQGLTNLLAFARLLGQVRHFHPSDQAAAADWLSFTVGGLPLIEAAEPQELPERLEAAFRSVAPTLRVHALGQEPALPTELTPRSGRGSLSVRVWEHLGYGPNPSQEPLNVYRSERLTLDGTDPGDLPEYARPTNVFRARLDPGICALVPTALFADDRGTLPHMSNSPARPEAGRDIQLSVGHRGARLATVMLAWNILEHFYPYFDVVSADWDQQLQIALGKAATDATETDFFVTLNQLLVALHDGHGSLAGPGVPRATPLPIFVELIEEKVVVTAVVEGVTNVQPGDIVRRVDGIAAREIHERIAGQLPTSTRPQTQDIAHRFGSGPHGTEAVLEVEDANGGLRRVSLRRSGGYADPARKRPPMVHEIKLGTWYVDITRISDADFKEALPRLEKARGIIFDVRGYPKCSPGWLGHLTSAPLQSAHWNIATKHRPDHVTEWVTSRWAIPPTEPQLTENRVFLTDRSAISYSETILGIVEAYDLGPILGEATAGTNGNINPTSLPLGYQMIWTGMKVLKHDGTRHHGIGIHPDIAVPRTIRGIREGRDEQLERAAALLAR